MRFAFLKQEIYQNLYIAAPATKNAADLLASSIMRTGPVGLFAHYDTDFYIIKEDPSAECQSYRTQVKLQRSFLEHLRDQGPANLPGKPWLKPGCADPQGPHAVAPHAVDWSAYDVVVSINVCLPNKIIKQHPRTLFCYMMGEASKRFSRWAKFGYDNCLTQNTHGTTSPLIGGAIDFPYTFLRSDTLATILRGRLGRPGLKKGVYAEINMSKERPVAGPPEILAPLVKAGIDVRWHRQNILENLTELCDSRYFVKLGGRKIRGNSIAEAISCGTLVLADHSLLKQKELVPASCDIRTIEALQEKISELEANPALYERELKEQQRRLDHFGVHCPILSTETALLRKRRLGASFIGRVYYRFLRTIAPVTYYFRKVTRRTNDGSIAASAT